jgi:hypothetical protein
MDRFASSPAKPGRGEPQRSRDAVSGFRQAVDHAQSWAVTAGFALTRFALVWLRM